MQADLLLATLEARVLCLPEPAPHIRTGYTSDLLSDVMANAPADSVLITVQAHLNAIAVCVLINARVLLICNNRPVPEAMLQAAQRENIAVAVTSLDQFHASARVHDILLINAN